MSHEAPHIGSVVDIAGKEQDYSQTPGSILENIFLEHQLPYNDINLVARKRELCSVITGVMPYFGSRLFRSKQDYSPLLPKNIITTYSGPYRDLYEKRRLDLINPEWLVQGIVESEGLSYDVDLLHDRNTLKLSFLSDHDLFRILAKRRPNNDVDFSVQSSRNMKAHIIQFENELELTRKSEGRISKFASEHPRIGKVLLGGLEPVQTSDGYIFAK